MLQTLKDRLSEQWVEGNGPLAYKLDPSCLQRRLGYEGGNYAQVTGAGDSRKDWLAKDGV